jgi:hypothetical protein
VHGFKTVGPICDVQGYFDGLHPAGLCRHGLQAERDGRIRPRPSGQSRGRRAHCEAADPSQARSQTERNRWCVGRQRRRREADIRLIARRGNLLDVVDSCRSRALLGRAGSRGPNETSKPRPAITDPSVDSPEQVRLNRRHAERRQPRARFAADARPRRFPSAAAGLRCRERDRPPPSPSRRARC